MNPGIRRPASGAKIDNVTRQPGRLLTTGLRATDGSWQESSTTRRCPSRKGASRATQVVTLRIVVEGRGSVAGGRRPVSGRDWYVSVCQAE